MSSAEKTTPQALTKRLIVDFLTTIGLEVRSEPIQDATFVPGIAIHHGALVVDPERWAHAGDLLHEAGHLAVRAPERRRRCHIDVGKRAAEDQALGAAIIRAGA